jgi:hypothetical protein
VHLLDLDDQVAPSAQRRRVIPNRARWPVPRQSIEDNVLDREKGACSEGVREESRGVLKVVYGPAYVEEFGLMTEPPADGFG